MGKKPNSYDLSREWWDFCFKNPEKINPKHTAIYFFAIEHCNRMRWKEKFGLPSQMTMEAIGIKKHQTYIKAFRDLIEWGFFDLIEESKNQYSTNIISLVHALPKKGKANNNTLPVCSAEKGQSTGQSKGVCSAEKGQSTGQSTGQSKVHILKPSQHNNQANQIKKTMGLNGWLGNFDELIKEIPFEAIECFWKNKLEKDLEKVSLHARGGFITNQIKTNAVEFYEEWQKKEKTEKAEKEIAQRKQEMYVSGASKWSVMDDSERKELHRKAVEKTELISKLGDNGDISNSIIEEIIFLELGEAADCGL